MARTNPFLLKYHKREDQITELLIHILKETESGSAFIGRLVDDVELARNRVVMDTQLHGELPYPVEKATIIGLSKDGVIYPTSSEAKDGNPDAYFYFPDLKRVVLVEVKVAANFVGRDQLDRQRSTAPKADFAEPVCFQWDRAIAVVRELLAEAAQGSKAEYLFKNFLEFAKVEALGMNADMESFLMRCENEKAARLMHEHFINLGYLPAFYTKSDPRTLEYKKNGESYVTIDLVQNRLIYKFGSRRHKDTMLRLIQDSFGRNYAGVHDHIKTEACVHLDDIRDENIQNVFDLFSVNVNLRNGGR